MRVKQLRITELRVVERVKEFRAELKERILGQAAEREALRKGQIEIVLPGAVHKQRLNGVELRFSLRDFGN
jgi:hypothetical protein